MFKQLEIMFFYIKMIYAEERKRMQLTLMYAEELPDSSAEVVFGQVEEQMQHWKRAQFRELLKKARRHEGT